MQRQNLHRLTLIFDVCMYCNFNTVAIKRFKSYDLSFDRQLTRVESKRHLNFAGGSFWRKGSFCRDFFTIDEQLIVRGFVHQHTGKLIFFTGGQILIAHNIGNRDLIRCNFFFAVCCCLCSDFRILNLYGLPFVVDVRMGSKQRVFTVQILENNDSFTMQTGCVKDKGNVYAAILCFCDKGSFSGDLFPIHK